MMNELRMNGRVRRELILDAAVQLASESHYTKITRQQIADRAGVAPGLVSHYLGTMTALRRDVMRHAVATEALKVIAQGILYGDSHATKVPQDLRDAAIVLFARGDR